MKKKIDGVTRFHEFYEGFWKERWSELCDSFKQEGMKVHRKSLQVESSNDSEEFLPLAFKEAFEVDEVDGLKTSYYMDPASIIVARNLDLSGKKRVLDMCAAPGGKSLILFDHMDKDAELICNELSRTRKERLKRVLALYISKQNLSRIDVRGFDGNKYGIHLKDEFDAILLDAPCSGERHLLEKPGELDKWAPKRSKRLAANQYSLLCSALLTCKPGGEIVYSTCSLSPLENDEVIKKLLDKKQGEVEVLEAIDTFGFGEKTEYGHIFLPDKCGFGPLYFSRLRKI